jgi:hypothetical protein
MVLLCEDPTLAESVLLMIADYFGGSNTLNHA